MAKSKTNKSRKSAKSTKLAKRSSRSRTNDKPSGLEATRSVVPEDAPPRDLGEMSSIEIGHVAGEVWGILSQHGELTLADLKKEVPASADLVLASIGWLAREDKLEFTTSAEMIRQAVRYVETEQLGDTKE